MHLRNPVLAAGAVSLSRALTATARGNNNSILEWTGLGQLVIAVGTPVARCPPHGPGRALISASGSYLG